MSLRNRFALTLSLVLLPEAAVANWPHQPAVNVLVQPNASSYGSVADGNGGVVIPWQDFRNSTVNNICDLYAGHVVASGLVDSSWPSGGIPFGLQTGLEFFVSSGVLPDGSGGALVCWEDARNGTSNFDIYCQHVLSSGQVDP